TIAGFDPSAGAGVLADIKTMSAFGCYGVAAITSLTLQNTMGVFGAYHQTGEAVTGQLAPLFDDFDIAAVKTGMLPSSDVIEAVASWVASRHIDHLVVDPVVRSTSGYDLINDEALRSLVERLFPLATIVTPNRAEAERISGSSITDSASLERAARIIRDQGARAVLITGGDRAERTATDLLVDADGSFTFSAERVESRNTHGTGCTLSSAIACLLARKLPLRDCIAQAKQYVVSSIQTAPGLGHGHGPLNHFPHGAELL
ncbi:MAG TPA: bifunctional hydroxymethylpyrimidine kinase/phosphomethylpyrimidine kinase, partial [Blastocatellia bacterium]|nr:bifunctional hydroxymethylpyrimidine kinase/phosphomethylpyrimidine kinase [Blastocatellia bacterium]